MRFPLELRAKNIPHYHDYENSNKKGPVSQRVFYHSKSILGKIFDLVAEVCPEGDTEWKSGTVFLKMGCFFHSFIMVSLF